MAIVDGHENAEGAAPAAPSAAPRDFPTFFRDEYPRIARELELMLGDSGAAADVAQEAFIKLYLHWKKVSRYDKPGAWTRRVAIRLAVRWRRSKVLPVSLIDKP